ncbi:MAG TPA: arylamine N-acetyltransferase [Vicinamibacterales bacterium]|nr:arylamine N-acetyltransferase [Vicinamibacterales bacterium]
MIALDAYFARIGYGGPVAPTLAVLDDIMQAHVQSVPFENLDVLLGRGIDLSPEALQRKLITDRRGGYCFEQNGLLLLVLEAIGFEVTPLSARVRYQRPRDYTPARTHLFLRVVIDGVAWVADVGVGALSLTSAIRFDLPGEQATRHEPRRIIREDGRFFHQVRFGDEWQDVLEFTGEEMPPIDRELANWFTSAHPQSHFKGRLIAARALPGGRRLTLLNRELSERDRSGLAQTRQLASPEELLAVLADRFALHFEEGTTFACPALDWPAAGA